VGVFFGDAAVATGAGAAAAMGAIAAAGAEAKNGVTSSDDPAGDGAGGSARNATPLVPPLDVAPICPGCQIIAPSRGALGALATGDASVVVDGGSATLTDSLDSAAGARRINVEWTGVRGRT
jgi:hypothetical protein